RGVAVTGGTVYLAIPPGPATGRTVQPTRGALTATARLDAVGAAPAKNKTDASRAAVAAAVAQSQLAALAPELREQLLADSRLIRIPSRSYFAREGDPPRLGLLVTGMIRAFRATADGREL